MADIEMEERPVVVEKVNKQVMCGHCKYTCGNMEELKQHMKDNHLNNPSVSTVKQSVAEVPKQTVVVYKQNADGTTVNTGQVVQLTQQQIMQLLGSSPVQQKPLTLSSVPVSQSDSQSADVSYISLHGSSITSGGKKQLLVVGAEQVDNLEKSALAAAGMLPKAKAPPASAAAARISLLAAGVPTFVSKIYPDDSEEGTVELKFQFTITGNEDMIDEHIKPVVSFQCQHCSYKDGSYTKACVHTHNFHLKADGTVIKPDRVANPRPEHVSNLTEDDLSCPYCLTKFLSLEDRDNHRMKKCGPKQRYEVKRTAVRSLLKHLLCPKPDCTRALYFNDHLMQIKHPRAVFGSCHRNNGPSHYFSCYVCASRSKDSWKDKPVKYFETIISNRIKELNERVMTQELGQESLSFLANENSAKNMEQTEEDGDDMSALPNSEEMGGATEEKKPEMVRRVLVPPENMRPWDFSSWKDCSLHLATEHKEAVGLQPRCEVCKKALTACNELCHHIFNNEIEFIENGMGNLRRKQSKKALKRGMIFGVSKENAADRMLFNEVADDLSALPVQTDDKTGNVSRKGMRNKHYMCRTCGQGFSSSAKRDKHIISNACVRDKVERKFECSVCNKRFSQKKTVLAHETWCMYKQKRDNLNMEDNATSALIDDVLNAGTDTESSQPAADSAAADSVAAPSGEKKVKKRAARYKCTIHGCIMGFNTEAELEIHLKCHIGTSVAYQCCFCDFTAAATVNWYPLKEHIIAKHPGHITPDYVCKICNKGFAKQSKFDDHMTKHSTARLHKCIECSLTFKQESGLRIHVQLEHGSEEAKEYARIAMKQRSSENIANQPLLCYVCGYSTTSRSYYKTHMNIHKGIKPYSCTECDYKSVDSTCFKRHMWRHEDKKPYKCTYCPFDGIQRSQIVAHMKSKHDVYPEDAKKLIKHISGRVASNIQTRPLHKDVGEEMELSPSNPPAVSLQTASNTTTVSIVNPDGTETTIPVELITQAAQGLAAGTNVQVAYGDYMINYMLEKAPEEEEAMDTQAYTAEQTE